MVQIIISVFIGLIVVDEFNISFRVKQINRRLGNLKFFRCLPCFTFWTSLITGIILLNPIKEIAFFAMASYIVASLLDNQNK